MQADYSGPVRLTPIPVGKPDPDLARVIMRHMQEVNPAIVIPWTPREPKVRSALNNEGAVYFDHQPWPRHRQWASAR